MLKEAYEAGVRQAMIDAGLLKESAEVYTGKARAQDTARSQSAQAKLQAAEKRVSKSRTSAASKPAASKKPFDYGSAVGKSGAGYIAGANKPFTGVGGKPGLPPLGHNK
jgi:hypothetical protein